MAESRTQGQMKQTRRQGRKLKPRSEVWKHFTRVIGDDGKEKAECMCCGIQYAIHGTTNQLKHLKECGGQESADRGAPPPPQTLPLLPCGPSSGSSGAFMDGEPSLDQHEAIRDLVRMIALNGYNPSIVEDEHFRSFVHHLNPEFRLPSRQAIEEMRHGILQLQAEEPLNENLEIQRTVRLPESINERVQSMESSVMCSALVAVVAGRGAAIPTAATAPAPPLLMTPATPPFPAARAHELPTQRVTSAQMQLIQAAVPVPPEQQLNKLCRYRGVRQLCGDWVAEIVLPPNGTLLCLGTFATAEEAALTYDRAAYRIHGDPALLNFRDNPASLAPLDAAADAKFTQAMLAEAAAFEAVLSKNVGAKKNTAHIKLAAAAASTSNSSSDEDSESRSVGQVVAGRTEIQTLPPRHRQGQRATTHSGNNFSPTDLQIETDGVLRIVEFVKSDPNDYVAPPPLIGFARFYLSYKMDKIDWDTLLSNKFSINLLASDVIQQ